MKRLHKHLLTAGLLAGLGFAAIAQPAAPAGPMGPGGPAVHQPHRMDPARMQDMRARMEKRMNERLEFFKFKLKLTPAQEGAWTAWTTAIKPSGARPPRLDRDEFRRLSTPERIDRMRALRASRDAALDKRMDATKAFYAELNPEQRKVFDEASLRFLGGGRGGHGGPRGGHHHHG